MARIFPAEAGLFVGDILGLRVLGLEFRRSGFRMVPCRDHGGIACSFCTHNAGNQCALLWLVLKHFFSAGAWEKCKTDAFFSGPPAGNATAQHKSEVMKDC